MYIEVTPYGIARISYEQTPADITGFYITGMESSVAIMLIGDHGISLIHAKGNMAEDTLNRELKWVGQVKKILFGFDPSYQTRIEMKNMLFVSADLMNDPPEFIETKSGIISIDRNAEVTTERPVKGILRSLPAKKKRIHINQLNSLQHGESRGDLQYDGQEFTHTPTLEIPVSKDMPIFELKDWATSLIPNFKRYSSALQIIQKLQDDRLEEELSFGFDEIFSKPIQTIDIDDNDEPLEDKDMHHLDYNRMINDVDAIISLLSSSDEDTQAQNRIESPVTTAPYAVLYRTVKQDGYSATPALETTFKF